MKADTNFAQLFVASEADFDTLPTIAISASDIAASATDNCYSTTVTDFTDYGLVAGQRILVAGFSTAGNNGYKRIKTVAANALTIYETLSVEAAGDTVTMDLAFRELEYTSDTLDYNIDRQKSQTVSQRVKAVIDVGAASAGQIGMELAFGAPDDLLESLLRGAWTNTVSFTGTSDIAASAVDNSYSCTTLDFTDYDLTTGQNILVSGFDTAGNNGVATIVSVAAKKIVVSGLTLATEGPDTVTIKASMLRDGTTKQSHRIERRYTDLTKYHKFGGMVPASATISADASGVMNVTFDMMGASCSSNTAATEQTTTPQSAVTTEKMGTAGKVQAIRKDNTALTTHFSSLSFALGGQRRAQEAVTSLAPIGCGAGQVDPVANAVLYFENMNDYDDFVAATEADYKFILKDSSSNYYVITFPVSVIMTHTKPDPGVNQDIMVNISLFGKENSGETCSIQIDRFAA